MWRKYAGSLQRKIAFYCEKHIKNMRGNKIRPKPFRRPNVSFDFMKMVDICLHAS